MLLLKHYFLSNATAPPQLNACWGDFPGKSPPIKRKILDQAGWVHYNRVRHPHTTSLLCRICVVFRQDRPKNSGPVLYTADAPVEKQMVGQYLGCEIWQTRWFPGTINLKPAEFPKTCKFQTLLPSKTAHLVFGKKKFQKRLNASLMFTKSPHSKICHSHARTTNHP